MNYIKNILPIFAVLLLLFVVSNSNVLAYSSDPPDEKTGAPNEGTCIDCHGGNTLNAAGGSLMLTVPENYSPGVEYDIIVNLSRARQSRWGFEMTALNSNGTRAGTFAVTDANTQVSETNSKRYIQHTSAGTAHGTQDTNSWTFKWTAPTTNVGAITFYAAGNAANGDGVAWGGDYIYTQKATSDVPLIYGVTLAGVSTLTKRTTDASAGVRYTLRVTNTGNTNDVIRLSSGSTRATLSPTSVSLAAGASANVTLTVPGSALATAGDYTVKVKATSQGDSSKIAEITTTTTILPVYGVALTGVGDLTTETADASEGVAYTLTVTNNGNTDDVIDLVTSGDAAATLSQTSVSLDAGASANVTLTISSDALATAGDYAVKVTATSQGDTQKTAEVSTTTTILPVYGVTLTGNNLTKQTKFANAGVSYALQVTNTGNTDDTIVLSSSAEVGIGGSVLGSFRKSKDQDLSTSQLKITLAPGASTEVIFTAMGDLLTKSGEYKIKVTATSQGDSTKTAEITTTTTILPVYDVTLTGVGNLTTETTNAEEGVTYTLNVTNTSNTDDVINLATSDDDATLSQTSVSLAAGVSTNVTLTIPSTALATAGEYVVKVTATSQGDNTKTSEVSTTTTILPVYGVTLVGNNLTKQTKFANAGVSYALQVTNTGNTDDTIVLSSSAEVGIGGSVLGSFRKSKDQDLSTSQLKITLAPGASTEVIFTAAGDLLTKSGEYKIKVTATSQGDSTKTAEITTTTTILPVYDVTLTGVGNLTTETTNAEEGVTYTLNVTNTSNTDDVINLATSDDDATLSQTSVSLEASASVGVVLTVSGDSLKTAGVYEHKVTATSQGDNTKTAEITTTTTILPVYGVTLAGVGDLTTETADASEGVSYMLTVTNIGNTDDVIDLATSADAAATLSQTSVPLAPGASAEVKLTISADAIATAGDYEVKVKATSQGDSTKTDEVSTTTTILPVYGVTLAGVGDLTTETADASKGVAYTLTITNIGNTDDVIDLTTTGNDATLSQNSVSLTLGASAEVTLTISGDALATAGDYTVKVTATSQGDSTKTDEVSTTTTILPVYGVTLAGALAGVGELTTETADASKGVAYTLTITNTGNTDDVIDLTTTSDDATLSQTSVPLAPGASAEVKLTISADALATAGDYAVKVTATSQGDNTKTAEITATTSIAPVYGVTLQGEGELQDATTDILAGVNYTLKVTNTGNTDDTVVLGSSAEAGIEGSVLGSFSQSDDQVPMSQLEIALAAGASAEVMFTAAGDFFTKPGEYEIKVTATSQGNTQKTAEVSTTTTILPVYGVTLVGNNLTKQTKFANAGVSYALRVTNTGNIEDTIVLGSSAEVGIGGSVLGSFRKSKDQDLSTSQSQLKITLAPGASTEVIFTATGDLLTKSGEYKIKVTATSQGDNTKTAEVTITTTILPVYGVTLAGVGDLTTETSDASEGVAYTLTITNTGNTGDVIDLATSDDVATLSHNSVPLAPGASAEVTLTISADTLAIAGDYEFKVTATSQGDNTKTTEVTTTTTILPAYGVTLVSMRDSTTEPSYTDEGISYTLTITNTGNTDDVIDLATSDDAATLSQTSVPLAAGASAEVKLTISADALATAGDYAVKVTATSQGNKTKTAEITATTSIAQVYGVMLEGDGELKGATMDILAGVSYTLTITNTGNTDDTIMLGSSVEVGIEGSVLGSFSQSNNQEPPMSQLEIALAAGASAEVIFTAAGDFFTKPGEYEIKVTATSQGDNTKTAELTTVTMIEPVPWDLNADGTVDILDLVQVANQFGESGEGLSGDVNMDGEVDILDLVQVASYFGKTQAEIVQANQ